ncbi:hypothetical protein FWF89_03915 [Candidatus Saccharibacteria bacterium]|nr:hypothetical protein [Candidatus Saccharibacteria bacterium]
MSPYYHAFVPGWNWWYLFAPLSILATVLLAWGIPTLRGGRIRRTRLAINALLFMTIASAVGFSVLLFVESSNGIVQVFDNQLVGYESPVWSLIFAGVAVVALGAIHFGVNLFFTGKTFRAKISKLKAVRHEAQVREFEAQRRAQRSHPLVVSYSDYRGRHTTTR